MRSIITCCLFLLFSGTTPACLWVTGTKYNGESTRVSGLSTARLLQHSIDTTNHSKGVEMEESLRASTEFNDRSDYAVALMYLGRSTEAVDLLLKLEQEKPGTYFVAANLGTAYELSGRSVDALHWINEGIRRDSKSHDGTEWLHAKILEAKIASEKDSAFFKNHSVLELRPEKIEKTIAIGGAPMAAESVKKAIKYQLAERLQFVKPPNEPVASLLFDYAAIDAVDHSLESSRDVLILALKYGYPPDKVEPILKLFEDKIQRRRFRENALFFAIALTIVGLLLILYKRGILAIRTSRPKAVI